MEPFEKDQLQDPELDALLKKWRSPKVPARLRKSIFPKKPWWIRTFTTSIRIPVPVACALGLVLALVLSRRPHPLPAPPPEIRTIRQELPVYRDRIVIQTVYRDRSPKAAAPARPAIEWVPVAELRPRILTIDSQ